MKLGNPLLEFRVLMPSMFRKILRHHGSTKTSIGLTLISILLSIVITLIVNFFLKGGPLGDGLLIAILAPAIIAPVMSLQMLRLLSDLDQAEEKLKILSNIDELTQTYNRRFFMQFGEQELKRSQRHGDSFSIALLDIDNFKQINDNAGHLIGDKVLQKLSYLLKNEIRQSDVFARYGGDEFVFLFPETNLRQALIWAERLYGRLAATYINLKTLEVQPSFSIGIATSDATTTSLDDLLAKADRALYQAKKSGGNQVVFG
jgi:diguanylate cyclase (GGDEF)-like protein